MNVAILGYGVVGSGVAKVLKENAKTITEKTGYGFKVTRILDKREFPLSEYRAIITNNFDDIANDSSIDVVVETMGGVEPAYSFVKTCLEKGKHVVSSNKELVAVKGAELLKIAESKNVNFFFEASVGGGIPVIRPISRCLAGNNIRSVAGILNGTTNFILTKMIEENMKFSDALSMAQKLGYAEADPTADVEGLDACRKICILSSLAFGKHVYPDNVHTEGISAITPRDISDAEKWGGAVKLIGTVRKLSDDKIMPYVAPHFVCKENLISSVNDVFNAVMVSGDAIDKAMFYGRGAGKFPTASAVVADIIDMAKADRTSISQVWEDADNSTFVEKIENNETEMYVRVKSSDKAVIEKFGAEIISDENGEVSFVTPCLSEKEIDEKLAGAEIVSKIRILAM